jgi:CheY-like chemotaxis protein
MSNQKTHAKEETILIVDDTPTNLRLLSQMLTKLGYKLRAATSGTHALESIRSSPPDLILLDVMMPEMNGYEVCEHLKADERTRDIPIIFISALDATEDKVRTFTAGGVDYVTKPFREKEVLARVETHLSLRGLHKQLEAANRVLEERNAELETRNAELEEAMDTIKTLSGLIPICAWCGRKVSDDSGQWVGLETYIETHSEVKFSHGICPDCLVKWRGKKTGQAETKPDVSAD